MCKHYSAADSGQLITKVLLSSHGFKLDEAAPAGVCRFVRKEASYRKVFVSVTFHNDIADDVCVGVTLYDVSGAVRDDRKKCVSGHEVTVDELIAMMAMHDVVF